MTDFTFETVNFIHNRVDEDIRSGKHDKIVTRFPPEPNGYLHIGHAKSICLNFGTAAKYKGICHLRFDDTNPEKESDEFAQAIMRDIKWLGFDWGDKLFHASDYFDELYSLAHKLIDKGLAYVDSLNAEQMRSYRGTLTEPGRNSPDRERSVEENKKLFTEMKEGKYKDGEYTLRAKIDMSSPFMCLRDPAIYRIKNIPHQRSGSKWCIYPMYDFTHCLSDSIEGITHSLCTLEFENNRAIYDWLVDALDMPCRPQQIEFARLDLTHTVVGKRHLKNLVDAGIVSGWDDPRMPTLSGLRSRGYPASAIRRFCNELGVSKKNTKIDFAIFEEFIRDELNDSSQRLMMVVDPLEVEITNYPAGEMTEISAPLSPFQKELRRNIHFTNKIFIERSDFEENPEPGFHRLVPGGRVRLRFGFVITCKEIIKGDDGRVLKIKCEYEEATLGGKKPADGTKVKGIIHWISDMDSVSGTVKEFGHLFNDENPLKCLTEGGKLSELVNKDSDREVADAKIPKDVLSAEINTVWQMERVGYYKLNAIQGNRPELYRIVDVRGPAKPSPKKKNS